MKRILALLLIIVLALSFGVCSAFADDESVVDQELAELAEKQSLGLNSVSKRHIKGHEC